MLTDERIMEIERDTTSYAIHRLDAIPFARAILAAALVETIKVIDDFDYMPDAVRALQEAHNETTT